MQYQIIDESYLNTTRSTIHWIVCYIFNKFMAKNVLIFIYYKANGNMLTTNNYQIILVCISTTKHLYVNFCTSHEEDL